LRVAVNCTGWFFHAGFGLAEMSSWVQCRVTVGSQSVLNFASAIAGAGGEVIMPSNTLKPVSFTVKDPEDPPETTVPDVAEKVGSVMEPEMNISFMS
jgi:hypothetical protein